MSLLAAALLAACGGGGGFGSGPGPAVTGSTGTVKVALLLPMTATGSTPGVAKALKQAAELALFDFDNPNIALVPKDTRGSAEGARAAAESAVQDGAELIIGPLFASEVSAALTAEGVAHVISRAGNLFSLAFRDGPVGDYDDARAQDAWRYPPFFHAMLDAGISLPPSVYEAWFLSAAHDDATLDRVIAALPAASRAAAAAAAP